MFKIWDGVFCLQPVCLCTVLDVNNSSNYKSYKSKLSLIIYKYYIFLFSAFCDDEEYETVRHSRGDCDRYLYNTEGDGTTPGYIDMIS